ncbi:hypothetical protein NP233_g1081 [Leucocoprinus birnbaumii]|uniref:Zn(2)-C6 fungal-type domain-containing protein n=1 Tax=Leucocoprinus birnbaumii TaxID=56174 RepID=A0AAD5YZW2_9AGAR|nr:hypothetical protein NP233_g1081 [Leucocoprinus birnbaumii]
MNPTLANSERVVKKVSRACNTCRLKRKKCDGLDPCAFCVDNKLECLYSKEPRRRGPPSGYLRYTETRVAILEILIGLYISKLPKKEEDEEDLFDPFFEIAQTLQSEAKTCTQDVWDAHKARWTQSPSAKVVEELVVSFAPFTPRSTTEAPVKTLLPPPTASASASTNHDRNSGSTAAAALSKDSGRKTNDKLRHSANTTPFTQTLKSDSFEATGTHDQLRDTASPEAPPTSRIAALEEGEDWRESVVAGPSYINIQEPSTSSVQLVYPPQSYQQLRSTGLGNASELGLALGLEDQEYTGSYWRTVDLPESESYLPLAMAQPNIVPPAADQVDLPPPDILIQLLDNYYTHAHPSYPLLPSRKTLDASIASPAEKSGLWNTLMLSICAYSGRLSMAPNSASTLPGTGGLAGKIAADLWYEQARCSLSVNMKKGVKLELVQASLLLALRDYGKGNESQAWVLLGLGVRMAQDLKLHEEAADSTTPLANPDAIMRRNVWGVCVILDLLLSLQMGRPPVTSDALKNPLTPASRSRPPDIDVNPPTPFAYAVSLCRVIALINFHLYLGYPSSAAQSPPDKLSHLRTELDMWHHSLPMQYRISIGHQPQREVLEVNMLYHVAIILLYRPISRDQSSREATDIFLEAASSFSVLLEKYRALQTSMTSSNPAVPSSTLSHTNPNMIYLIYTVAIAHLSGYKIRQVQGNPNTSPTIAATSALQTQLHLLKCLEALASIGFTWELARRCWKALDTFMEIENLKPRAGESPDGSNGSLTLGKRKREGEEAQKQRIWQPMVGRMDSSSLQGPRPSQPNQIQQQAQPQPQHAPHPVTSYPVNLSSPVTDLSSLMTPSPNLATPAQFTPTGFAQLSQLPPTAMGSSGWNEAANVAFGPTNEVGLPAFDPSLYSTKWMPDASQALNAEWNNSWDENAWSQSYVNGMGMF